MSVWKSDEKLLIFASLISPSKIILFETKYQTFDTVFHHQMKHLEVRQKYYAARHIFNSLLGSSSGGEILRLTLDILEKRVSHNLRREGAHKKSGIGGRERIRVKCVTGKGGFRNYISPFSFHSSHTGSFKFFIRFLQSRS